MTLNVIYIYIYIYSIVVVIEVKIKILFLPEFRDKNNYYYLIRFKGVTDI